MNATPTNQEPAEKSPESVPTNPPAAVPQRPANPETSDTAAMQELDVKGLKCPLPILRTKKLLATLETGTLLRVLATDAGSKLDFEAFSKHTGNALLSFKETDGVLEFVFRRK